jgi:hypothetical protein
MLFVAQGFLSVCVAGVLATGSAAQGVADALRIAAFASERVHDAFVDFCDAHPARLTGSAAHAAATAHVRALGEELGLRIVATPLRVERTWVRGDVSLEALVAGRDGAARSTPIEGVAGPWTPSLPLAVELRLVVDPAPGADLEGAAVLASARALRGRAAHPFPDAALVLVPSERPHALLAAGGVSGVAAFEEGPVPTCAISSPSAAFLRRRVESGGEVRIRAQGGGRCDTGAFLADPCLDLPGVGSEGRAEEVVLVAVGLDSWDLGPGATSDAAGVTVALEALRLLRGLERRPQRTIRFAFLGGQAQGIGTTAYAASLSDEDAEQHVGGFVLEGGGGRILGLALDGAEEHLAVAESWFEPVRDLGVTDVGYRASRTGMPRALQQRGIPCFAFVVEGPDLASVEGTRADVPELVDAHDLQQASCVLATSVWRLANAKVPPPRFPN